MIRSKLSLSLTLSALLLSGCALGPDYQRPTVKMPVAFKESAGWKVGEPQQVNADPNWWSHFNDPVLGMLRLLDRVWRRRRPVGHGRARCGVMIAFDEHITLAVGHP